MLDDELKHEDLVIDEKEAKRQFLEELRNKNKQENDIATEDEKSKNNETVSDEELNAKEEVDEMLKEELISKEEIASTKDTEVKSEVVEKKELVDEDSEKEEIVSEETVVNETESVQDTIEMDKSKDEETNEDVVTETGAVVLKESDEAPKESKPFLSSALKVSLIDTAVTALSSFIGVYLFDLILRIFGYHVVDFKGIYIIIFLIILVLYPAIMDKSKYGKTLGQKFSKI